MDRIRQSRLEADVSDSVEASQDVGEIAGAGRLREAAQPGQRRPSQFRIVDEQGVDLRQLVRRVSGATSASAVNRRAQARPVAPARSIVPGAGRMNFLSRSPSISTSAISRPRSVDQAASAARSTISGMSARPDARNPSRCATLLGMLEARSADGGYSRDRPLPGRRACIAT